MQLTPTAWVLFIGEDPRKQPYCVQMGTGPPVAVGWTTAPVLFWCANRNGSLGKISLCSQLLVSSSSSTVPEAGCGGGEWSGCYAVVAVLTGFENLQDI